MNQLIRPDPRRVILVVDDAIDTLKILCDALTEEGYTVIIAQDAIEAIARFEITVPDGVLLDAIMPGLSGFELCRQLKATPHWSHVPIIFMTGLSESDQIVEGFASGGVDYVVKPLRIPEVLARLATHLKNAQVVRQARQAIDIAGLGVVVLDNFGQIAWQSPQSSQWLEAFFPGANQTQPKLDWLIETLEKKSQTFQTPTGQQLHAQLLGENGLSETMLLLRVESASNRSSPQLISTTLTNRETEVLSWVAKGKTNKDIGDILGLSPRTVNKHLEHIYEKLGVETRTAAVSVGAKLLTS